MIRSVYLYKIRTFDFPTCLNKLKENNIKVFKLHKVNDYEYTFYAPKHTHKKINNIFFNVEVIKETGYASVFFSSTPKWSNNSFKDCHSDFGAAAINCNSFAARPARPLNNTFAQRTI